MVLDSIFYVMSKTAVQGNLRSAGFRRCDAFGNQPTRPLGQRNHGDWTMIPLNYHFHAFANIFQHGVEVIGDLAVGHMNRSHTFDHSGLFAIRQRDLDATR